MRSGWGQVPGVGGAVLGAEGGPGEHETLLHIGTGCHVDTSH